MPLFIDSTTGPLTYNPNISNLVCTLITADIQYSNSSNLAGYASGVLSYSPGLVSLRSDRISITGTTNTISSLSITNVRNNGLYFVAIQNNGTGNLTINNTGLGANIKTTYSTITVLPNGSALMTINIITINATQTTIVDVKVLT
jgi:hypothetical protein